jgi:hypothetical protein
MSIERILLWKRIDLRRRRKITGKEDQKIKNAIETERLIDILSGSILEKLK